MTVMGVDPGNTESAWVVFTGTRVIDHGFDANTRIRERWRHPHLYRQPHVDVIVFEAVESYGMAVGIELFETVFWTGRLFEVASTVARVDRVTRRAVKLHLCHSARAKDPNVRQALIDRFGPARAQAIGTKAQPGPLYGIATHGWAALAVAVTWWDQQQAQPAGAVPTREVAGP